MYIYNYYIYNYNKPKANVWLTSVERFHQLSLQWAEKSVLRADERPKLAQLKPFKVSRVGPEDSAKPKACSPA